MIQFNVCCILSLESTKGSQYEYYQVGTIFWRNRCSGAVSHVVNRMKHSKFQKRDKTYSVSGVCGRMGFSTLSPSYTQSPKKPWKISLSYSFAVGRGHFDMMRWKYDSGCIFSMLRDTLELILWKKADKKCKVQNRINFFAKGALIGKNINPTQRINAVHGRCPSSGVLRHISSNFTRSGRRRIVL